MSTDNDTSFQLKMLTDELLSAITGIEVESRELHSSIEEVISFINSLLYRMECITQNVNEIKDCIDDVD